jgi:dTDP-4-amino-4,6-dideoxygalactose transaminase
MIFFFFFKFIKFSKKFKINFFLKKYRTDFNLSIEPKIPKNYLVRMHSFQKILLINQFKNFKNQHLSRIEKSNYYFKNLKHIKEITFPQDDFSTKNLFIDFPIIVDEKQKKIDLCNYFLSKNLDIKDYYYSNCGSNQLYKKYIFNNIINSNKFANNIIMLPVSEKITKKYQDYIIRNMIYFFKNN